MLIVLKFMTLDEELHTKFVNAILEVRIPLPFLWEGNNVIEMAPFSVAAAQQLATRLVEEARIFTKNEKASR